MENASLPPVQVVQDDGTERANSQTGLFFFIKSEERNSLQSTLTFAHKSSRLDKCSHVPGHRKEARLPNVAEMSSNRCLPTKKG